MGNNTGKDEMKEKVRISNLKHRGNLLAISKETGISYYFVQKIVEKLKREAKRVDEPYNVLVAKTVSDYLIEGHRQRITYLDEMIRSLEHSENTQVSDCCKATLRISKKDSGESLIKCRACDTECKSVQLNHLETYNLKKDLIAELRTESREMVNFLVKMGYSNVVPQERGPIVKQEFIVVGGGNGGEKQRITQTEALTMEQIANLPPAERDKLRKELKVAIAEIAKNAVDAHQEKQQ